MEDKKKTSTAQEKLNLIYEAENGANRKELAKRHYRICIALGLLNALLFDIGRTHYERNIVTFKFKTSEN